MFRLGNEEAFRVIHDRYRTRLLAYTRQMLAGSRNDAEDALQDVYLRAYAALRADDRPVTLRAWLYRVAHNRCIDQLRRPVTNDVELFDNVHALHGEGSDPFAEVQRREDLQRLVADVGRLPDQQRSALLMREMEGLTYQELAGALEVSVPAVKSLLVRARVGLMEAQEARDTACVEIRDDITAAHDRGVRASGRTRRHLRECDGCRSYRSGLRGVGQGLGALSPSPGIWGLLTRLLGIGGAGSGAAAGTSAVAGGSAVVGGGAVAASGGAAVSGTVAVGAGAAAVTASKVAAVICCAALVGGGAVEVSKSVKPPVASAATVSAAAAAAGHRAASVAPLIRRIDEATALVPPAVAQARANAVDAEPDPVAAAVPAAAEPAADPIAVADPDPTAPGDGVTATTTTGTEDASGGMLAPDDEDAGDDTPTPTVGDTPTPTGSGTTTTGASTSMGASGSSTGTATPAPATGTPTSSGTATAATSTTPPAAPASAASPPPSGPAPAGARAPR